MVDVEEHNSATLYAIQTTFVGKIKGSGKLTCIIYLIFATM